MRKITGCGFVFIAATMLFTAACQKNTSTTNNVYEGSSASGTPGNASNGNLAAPVSNTAQSGPSAAEPAANTAQPAAQNQPSADQTAYSDGGDDYDADFDSNEQPVYASEAPPPLPDYSQPPCPEQDDIWTPGYWNYTSSGYYWVPGAWVMAPYVGALWTPPYWAFVSGRYRLHHGYWAANIGFYGGINYGFGYVGRGYYGGYWHARNFFYNRSVTNINVNVIHNVYVHNVVVNNIRISYTGGNGGIRARPIPAELAVLHEHRIAPVPEQIQHVRQFADNRAQFVQANHGHPEMLAAVRPLATSYHAPAPEPRSAPEAARGAGTPMERPNGERPNERFSPTPAPVRNERAEPQPSAPARPMEHANERPAPEPARNNRPEARPVPEQPRPEVRNAPAPRPESQPRVESHPNAPAEHQPQPRVESHPNNPAPRESQPRFESRPAPPPPHEPHAAPAARQEQPRPAPAAHQEQPRPAPAAHQEQPRPAPAAHPAPPHPAPEAHPNSKPEHPNPKDTEHH